jgi:hypothetical protein
MGIGQKLAGEISVATVNLPSLVVMDVAKS